MLRRSRRLWRKRSLKIEGILGVEMVRRAARARARARTRARAMVTARAEARVMRNRAAMRVGRGA